MNEHKGIGDIFKDIWHSPAILATLIVGVLLVGYLLIKSNKSTVIAPGGPGTSGDAAQPGQQAGSQGPGYYLQEDTIVEPPPVVNVANSQTVGGVNVTAPAPAPPVTITKTVQKPYTISGVEGFIEDNPNGGAIVDTIEHAQRAKNKRNPDNHSGPVRG